MGKIELAGDDRDGLRVLALMLFPDANNELREQWISIQAVKRGGGIIEDLSTIVDAPSYAVITKHTSSRLRQGVLVGTLMFHLYVMYKLNINTSLIKSIGLTREWAKNNKYGGGEAIRRAESTLYGYKKRFEPVAHMWAAFVINLYFPFYDTKGIEQEELFDGGLSTFMGASSGLLDFGTTFVSKGARRTFQDADNVFAIPKIFAQMTLNLNLDHEIIKNIKNSYI